MRYAIYVGIVVLTLLIGASTPASSGTTHAQAQPVAIAYHVPVIINIYNAPNTTEQEARDAVKEANKILKQADIGLRVVKVNTIGPNDGGADHHGGDDGTDGTKGDGDLTTAEGDKVQTYGGDELKKLPNEKGLKISFTDTPWVGHATPGWSKHRDPTIVVKERAAAGGPQGTGATIAHEFGHVLTIKNHSEDGTNFMAASNKPRTDTKMTPDQIDEMTGRTGFLGLGGREISSFSKCATQFSEAFPAVKCSAQFGGTTDDRGDQTGSTPPAYYDLHQVFLNSLHASDQSGGDVDNIYAQITVSGLLPGAGDIDAMYAIGLDSDNSSGTGVTYAGYAGIDRIVYLNATGDIALETFDVSGAVLDPVLSSLTPLPEQPLVDTEDRFPDNDEPSVPTATSFLIKIPKSLLGLADAELPAVAVAGLVGSLSDYSDDVLYDLTDDLTFDMLRFASDPTLETFGTGVPTPGELYPFEVSGLLANDDFDLYLDDDVVFSGTLDGSGGLAGDFEFPLGTSNKELHFLTAQDSTGEIAYSITCPDPGRVGGIGEQPEFDMAPVMTPGSSGPGAGLLASIAAAVTAGAFAIGGAAWYGRRRWLK